MRFPIILSVLLISIASRSVAVERDQTKSTTPKAEQTAQQEIQQTSTAWQAPTGLRQVPIWPHGAPDMTKRDYPPESTLTITPPSVGLDRNYTQVLNVTQPTMTIFPPRTPSTGAAIVVFPGGGFRILAIDLEGTEICDWVTAQGMTCVLLKYRVPKGNHYWDKDCRCHIMPKVPLALQDAQRTIRLVRTQAKELNIDSNKIGVIGFSAGAYLVAQVSNIFKSSYRAIDAADQLSSRPDFAIALYPGHLCRKGEKLDPSLQVTKQTTPTFLLQAWDDPVDKICNSTVYAKALSDAGVDSEVHLFAKGGHAFGLRGNPHPISTWPKLVENWLRELGILAVQSSSKD